jgi:hypothetical protein
MPAQPVHVAGRELKRTRHVCALFNNPEEQYRVLMPFIEEGFRSGDFAFHIVDDGRRAGHEARLRDAGIDVNVALRDGQLVVKGWSETYIATGRFDKDATLAVVDEFFDLARSSPYPMMRVVANMDWALADLEGARDLVDYETRANNVTEKYEHAVICAYDFSKFDATTIAGVVRAHPMVIVGGALYPNPFYLRPEEYLRDVAGRGMRWTDDDVDELLCGIQRGAAVTGRTGTHN